MVQRFDEFYKVGRNDNLGDPDYWNRRFKDLDLRLAAREVDGDRITGAVAEITSVALSRLNDTFTPIVNEAIERLSSVGALFTSTSDTEVTIDNQPKTFVLAAETRSAYVVSEYVSVRPIGLVDRGMICSVTEYDRATGLLTVQPELIFGTGTFSAWDVKLAGTPDLDHATRLDNPHQTTAAQVGAYTKAQVDAALDAKAATDSPQFTGAPKVPTATAGVNSNQIANMTAVRAEVAALSATLTPAIAQSQLMGQRVNLSAGYTAVAADIGRTFNFTATCTLSFAAATALKAGWFCFVRVTGANTLIGTLDPNGSETIDGDPTQDVLKGQEYMVVCDGVGFFSVGRPREWLMSTATVSDGFSVVFTIPAKGDQFVLRAEELTGTFNDATVCALGISTDGASIRSGVTDYIYTYHVTDLSNSKVFVNSAVASHAGALALKQRGSSGLVPGGTVATLPLKLEATLTPGRQNPNGSGVFIGIDSEWYGYRGDAVAAPSIFHTSGVYRNEPAQRAAGWGLFSPNNAWSGVIRMFGRSNK